MTDAPHRDPVPATLSEIWRYPVKSMAGEALAEALVGGDGLVGDRAHALVDLETGRVATAKNPRVWPGMFACSARPGPVITLPDGRVVDGGRADADELLSAALGRRVHLQAAGTLAVRAEEYWPDLPELALRDQVTDFALPPGRFVDAAPVHLVTTSTLRRLRELHPDGDPQVRRFRPNLVVDTGEEAAFLEDDWTGRTLSVGDDVRLAVTGPCVRCVMVTLPQPPAGDLPALDADPAMLRTAVRQHSGHVGVYASVLRGGPLRAGDAVVVES